jgi:hypothetical protein
MPSGSRGGRHWIRPRCIVHRTGALYAVLPDASEQPPHENVGNDDNYYAAARILRFFVPVATQGRSSCRQGFPVDGSHQSFASSVSGTTSTSDIQQHNEDEVSTPVISNRILSEQTVPVIQLPSPAMMETNSHQSKAERNSSRNGRIQKQSCM